MSQDNLLGKNDKENNRVGGTSQTKKKMVGFKPLVSSETEESSSDTEKPEVPVSRKSAMRPSKKRFPLTIGTKGRKETSSEEEDLEDDPVMALFQSRYKTRVRFSLDEEAKEEEPEAPPQDNSPNNIKKFVKGALFGVGNRTDKSKDEFEQEVANEVQAAGIKSNKSFVWSGGNTQDRSELIFTHPGMKHSGNDALTMAFTENPETRNAVIKLLNKARTAQFQYYRYEHAVKYFVKALELLTNENYPDNHPTVEKTLKALNNAHHALSSYNNSANIVKMGIKYEDSGELVRALKMYSIAYRIRRDNLSRRHPSLVVLLNMLGSIQKKRGELEEAMLVYELALKNPLDSVPSSETEKEYEYHQQGLAMPQKGNLLAKIVTYREMGTICEKWDKQVEALKMYHLSLDCVTEYRAECGVSERLTSPKSTGDSFHKPASPTSVAFQDLGTVKVVKSRTSNALKVESDGTAGERGEMELFMDEHGKNPHGAFSTNNRVTYYDSFFPQNLERQSASSSQRSEHRRGDYADLDVALTIHQIAQLHRKQGRFHKALEAYDVALRGMKYALGKNHPNVAAVLGNIGNLQKEMGDLDAAYGTYQKVLGIESYRLGLSHPDVAITLHNIATIDAARGNHERALTLYKQVVILQKKLFGKEHLSVAVTAACMGDVFEQIGQLDSAMRSFEESLRIKTANHGIHSLEVARILHKLGKVSFKRNDNRLANSFIARAIFVYRLNKLPDDHEWAVDAHRDAADVDAALAVTRKITFEC